MAQELGLQSLHIPEEYGGQGFTFVELGIVLEEMGRVLLCAPYFSTVVLGGGRDPERGHRRPEGRAAARHRVGRDDRHARVHRAERPVGRVGHHDRGDRHGRQLRASTARRCSCSTGTPPTSIVVVARAAGTSGEDGISFFTVDGDADGPHAHAAGDDGPDPQAGEARVRRRQAARRSATPARAGPRCRRRSTRPRSASSNEMVGGAQ